MYLPAGYDDSDEDEFDEFGYISDKTPFSKKTNYLYTAVNQTPTEDYDTLLYNAVLDDNVGEVKRIIKQDAELRSGACLRQGWPILFHACYEAKLEIAEYLVGEEGFDVNRSYNLETALMMACNSPKPTELVYPIVRLLLEYGAIIGVLDRYGCSPLMFACKKGHLEVVKEIVGESSTLSVDNEGNTALFYAVQNNHLEIVKVLLKAGAQTNIVDRHGFTPRQTAVNSDYMDIAELLPMEEDYYELPAKYMTYENYRNFIHGDREHDFPEYFPDLGLMLFGMKSEKDLRFFAQANVSLFELLTITDDRLREIGIKYPVERKRILLGLYDFHRQPWAMQSLRTETKEGALDFYDVQQVLGNFLRQLTVIHGTLLYTKQLTTSRGLSSVSEAMQSSYLLQTIADLRVMVRSFEAQIVEIHKLSTPKPVFHISSQCIKPNATVKAFKVGICLIIGTFAMYLKLKK